MNGKRVAISLLLVFVVGSLAVAQTQYGSLDSLAGEVLFFYEWPASAGPVKPEVTIGDSSRARNFEGPWEMRLILGRDGVVFHRLGEAMYFAPSHATIVELSQVDLDALDPFRKRARWRFVGEHEPEMAFDQNFSYTLSGGTGATLTADEVLVTPEHLVVVYSGGHRVRIMSRDVVAQMTLLSTPQSESQAATRDLTKFESTRPFRGLKWGDPPWALGALQQVRHESPEGRSVGFYRRPWEDLNLGGGFVASSIEYVFLDDKLASIVILVSEDVDIDHASPELREIAERYQAGLADATNESERRAVQSKYGFDLYRVLESQISEEWGGIGFGGGLGLTQWRQGTDSALLTRDLGSMSHSEQLYLVLSDMSAQ